METDVDLGHFACAGEEKKIRKADNPREKPSMRRPPPVGI